MKRTTRAAKRREMLHFPMVCSAFLKCSLVDLDFIRFRSDFVADFDPRPIGIYQILANVDNLLRVFVFNTLCSRMWACLPCARIVIRSVVLLQDRGISRGVPNDLRTAVSRAVPPHRRPPPPDDNTSGTRGCRTSKLEPRRHRASCGWGRVRARWGGCLVPPPPPPAAQSMRRTHDLRPIRNRSL
jgi:hypothetical protein